MSNKVGQENGVGIEATEKEVGKELYQIFRSPHTCQPLTQPQSQRKLKPTPKRKLSGENSETSDQLSKLRPQTPSGQVLTNTIEDLKNKYLQSAAKLYKHVEVRHEPDLDERASAAKRQGVENLLTLENLASADCVNNIVMKVGNTKESNQSEERNDTCSGVNAQFEDAADNEMQIDGTEDQRAFKAIVGEMLATDQDVTPQKLREVSSGIKDAGNMMQLDKPTMDVVTVVQLMNEMRIEMQKAIKIAVRDATKTSSGAKEQLTVNKKIEELEKDILQTKLDVTVCQAKERMMVDAMAHNSDVVKEIQQKLEMIDINEAKRTVILSGFEGSTKKYVFRRQVETFIYEKLEVEINIEDFYFIGTGDLRDVVLVLPSTGDKRMIFQNIDKLKNIVNSKGRRYTFRDFLTAKQQQIRKKGQAIAAAVEKRDPVDREEVTTVKGKIFVGEHVYKPRITPPDPTQVLRLSIPKLNQIMGVELQSIEPIYYESNRFRGYSLCTNSFQEIEDAYMKICLNHAEARHIIAAWNLPGVNEFEWSDCCDDEDHGAAQPVLDMLIENNIASRAVFIVRNRGKKLNADRVRMYIECAKKLVTEHPRNHILDAAQQIKEDASAPRKQQQDQQRSPVSYSDAVKMNKKPRPVYTAKGRRGEFNPQRGGRGRGRGNQGRGRGNEPRGDSVQKDSSKMQKSVVYVPKGEEEIEAMLGRRSNKLVEN